jgi:hypothetical protein
VATRTPIATRLSTNADTGPQTFAGLSELSPDGQLVITERAGVLTLRHADATLGVIADNLFASSVTAGDRVTEPYWSSDGHTLVFTGWDPTAYACNPAAFGGSCTGVQIDNGDLTPYGQIYIGDVTPTGVGNARLLVPRSSTNNGHDYSSYYPALSDDSAWVVFDQVSCNGTPPHTGYPQDRTNTASNCAGYDNAAARLMLVPAVGGAPVDLARMNSTGTWTNSWPRWAPDSGMFRGQRLYWVAFSSKRAYGLRLAGDPTGADATVKPQLWFGAVTIDPAHPTADPSHAPVWLPMQDLDMSVPTGNHAPQWVAVFVPAPG